MYEVSKLPHITNVTTQYRVKGSFYFEVDTSSYPFESHMLELTFEDPQRTTRDLKFVPDEKYSGLSRCVAVGLHGRVRLEGPRVPGQAAAGTDAGALAPSNIKFPGFASADIQTRVEVEDVLYPPFDEAAQTFSRIKYIIEVERPKVSSGTRGRGGAAETDARTKGQQVSSSSSSSSTCSQGGADGTDVRTQLHQGAAAAPLPPARRLLE